MAALPLLKQDATPAVFSHMQARTNRILEKLREGLLEARDETDARWLRNRAVQKVMDLFRYMDTARQDLLIMKLGALESIEREYLNGHAAALQRTIKWRKALVERYFPE